MEVEMIDDNFEVEMKEEKVNELKKVEEKK